MLGNWQTMLSQEKYIELCDKYCKDALNKGLNLLPQHRQNIKNTKPKKPQAKEFLKYEYTIIISEFLITIVN